MNENYKISNNQFMILVILFSIGAAILIIPGTLTSDMKQTAWLPILLGMIINLFIVYIYTTLGKQISNMSIVEYLEKLLGKWLGKFISSLYFIFFFITCASALWVVGEFITTQVMPDTPKEMIVFTFICIIIMGSRFGIEVLSRTGELLVPIGFILFIILLLLITPEIKVENLLPVFDIEAKSTIKSTIHFLGLFSLPNVTLLMIYPNYVTDVLKAKKSFYVGTTIAGIILLLVTLYSILVLGHRMTTRNVYPVYTLAKKINLLNFINRVEVLFALIWFITYFFRVSLYFYSSVKTLSKILNLKDSRPLTIPLGLIVSILALIVYPNSAYASEWDKTTWIPFVSTFGLVIPLLLLFISKVKSTDSKEQ